MVALLLVGCASSGGKSAAEAVPGSAAEVEVHRLAHTRLQLAALHLQEGRPEVALGEVVQALQSYPRYVDAFNLKGWIHLALEDHAAAQASFAQALSLRPGDADTLYNVAWLQCQQRQFAPADQGFDAALAAPRANAAARARTWMAKGVCLRQAGQPQAALAALEKAYEMEPGNPAIAYNFAALLWQQGQGERARFYVRRVNNGQWASAASLWLGVKIERSMGDSAAMRQWAEQLQQRFPDSQEAHRLERGAFND